MTTALELMEAKLATQVSELDDLIEDGDAYEAKEKEIERTKAAIVRARKNLEHQKQLARPVVGDGLGAGGGEQQKGFDDLGQFLAAVIKFYSPERSFDPRLIRAPSGANESEGTAGGFLLQQDLSKQIWQRAFDSSPLVNRTTSIPLSSNATSIKIPALVDESRATGSRWGGVRVYWTSEGNTVDASNVKFRQIELSLASLMGVWYISDDLMNDASVIAAIAQNAFAEELAFVLSDSILRGDGVGKPTGLLNSAAKVTVAKESGQAANSIVKENIDKMYSRMWPRSLGRAAWFYNPDIQPALFGMTQVVGTGGVPVYLPPGGLSAAPYGTLYGLPMIPIEHAETLGTEGDLMLLDLSQYLLLTKGAAQTAQSMHVRFLYNEQTFKITFRFGGKPAWNAPVTPYKGNATLSPFITLATRA